MTGRLWPFREVRDGETGPATRLRTRRKGILIPDLMVAFEINVAGVIARRGYPMLKIAWRPRVPGVGGRSRGKSKARARWRGYGEPARDEDAKGQWRSRGNPHPGDPRPHVVSQRPDLQRLRHREPETEAGTHVELPELRTRHDRNLRAAINLRNLIMPAGRSRDGPGQEAMGQQGRRLRAKVISGIVPPQKVPPLPRGA